MHALRVEKGYKDAVSMLPFPSPVLPTLETDGVGKVKTWFRFSAVLWPS